MYTLAMSKDWGNIPQVHPKNKRWAMEVDYVERLSPKDRAWLSQFNQEFHTGYFPKGRKPLHRTKKARRECYARNNLQNRDLHAIWASVEKLESLEELGPIPNQSRRKRCLNRLRALKEAALYQFDRFDFAPRLDCWDLTALMIFDFFQPAGEIHPPAEPQAARAYLASVEREQALLNLWRNRGLA